MSRLSPILFLLVALALLGPAAALLGPATARAQEPAAFVRLGFGARGVALGNAVSADAQASPFYNPALAPFATRQEIEASVGRLSFDRSLQYIAFATPLRRAGIAAGLAHATVSNIDGRDNSGFHTGMLSTSEYAGFLAFGLAFGQRVTAGVSLQLFRSELYDGLNPVNSAGVDFGVTVLLPKDVRVALVLDDLLARYTWDTSGLYGDGGKSTTDAFPRRVRLGAAGTVYPGVRLMAEYEARFQTVEAFGRSVELFGDTPLETLDTRDLTLRSDLVRAGATYRPVPEVEFRLGMDRTAGGEGGGFRPAAGFGLDQVVGAVTIRVAYTYAREPHAAGSAHYASLRLYLDPN